MQSNKSADRMPKNAVQAICDAIFKVVDYRLKELDSKWNKQLQKIDRNVVIESAAPSQSRSILAVPFSIAVSDWTRAADGMYVYEVANKGVINSMVLAGCNLAMGTSENIFGPMCWETATGKVVLSVLNIPSGVVEGELLLCEAV